MKHKSSLLFLVSVASAMPAALAQSNETPDDAGAVERISVLGSKSAIDMAAGSVTLIDEATLEKFEYDDIGRILATVPGVNIRQEDGYGLRPNIGFRGVTPERSKKINLMEDGVLIGPAPYSAPAAYYFPMTSRMSAVEVTKGPSTIKYGPNTVAGALNLVTRQVPLSAEAALDLATGTDGYKKLHGHYGNSVGDTGFLIEGLHVGANGFKQLDGGGDTGFSKNDLTAKVSHEFSSGRIDHLFELKLGYADETSDETYLGLTDEDFAQTPYRRYAASQLAEMTWDHSQLLLTYHVDAGKADVTTRVYRNDFHRQWFKMNGFTSSTGGQVPGLGEILHAPDAEINQPYYQILTGSRDSSLREILVLGNNDREYYSQGIQFDAGLNLKTLGVSHQLEAGLRFHEDEIQRNHTEQHFFMRQGDLVSTGEAVRPTSTNTEQTDAVSVYLQDTVSMDALRITAGVRGEFIDSDYQNRAPGKEQDFQLKSQRIWLPSISAHYALSPNAGVFAGVHQGFVPTSPIQPVEIAIEKSVNYELGWRFADNGNSAEIVGFFSDYSNLKESCSISAGCDTDQEFNAGEVDIYGLEAVWQHTYHLTDTLSVPLSVTYTHTQSEFKQSFYSPFEQWGFVNQGNPVPYLAENMFSVTLGLEAQQWAVAMLFSYIGEMPETAQTSVTGDSRDATLTGAQTEAYKVLDVSASYRMTGQSEVYLKADNLFDEAFLVSRRPFGARPGKPRQFVLGYKYRF